MKRFVKTTVPSDGYKEVQQIGDRYLVHMEGVQDGDATTCYECMTDDEPDLAQLSEDLQEYKAYVAAKELEVAKREKIAALMAYDSSDAVNSFTINGVSMWLDHQKREQLRVSVEAYKATGTETVTKWFGGVAYTFNVNAWIQMLNVLEVYASEALNNTERHKAVINTITTVAEVEAYDFETGYPAKPEF